jgi:acetyl-CoA carboxylase biotin carboxyl carrier protein
MKIEEIAQIINILKQTDVMEFEIDQDGTHIRLSRASRSAPIGMAASPVVGTHGTHVEPAIHAVGNVHVADAVSTEANSAMPAHFVKVESPIVGTFYRKPSPDSDVFVKEGSSVKKGDTLCIIEAMKLMNEIDAPCDGRVEKILLSEGHVVEFGEALFYINPKA